MNIRQDMTCPKFENSEGIITSVGIKNIILWGFNPNNEIRKETINYVYSSKLGILKMNNKKS